MMVGIFLSLSTLCSLPHTQGAALLLGMHRSFLQLPRQGLVMISQLNASFLTTAVSSFGIFLVTEQDGHHGGQDVGTWLVEGPAVEAGGWYWS